jgi:hypothetical protein
VQIGADGGRGADPGEPAHVGRLHRRRAAQPEGGGRVGHRHVQRPEHPGQGGVQPGGDVVGPCRPGPVAGRDERGVVVESDDRDPGPRRRPDEPDDGRQVVLDGGEAGGQARRRPGAGRHLLAADHVVDPDVDGDQGQACPVGAQEPGGGADLGRSAPVADAAPQHGAGGLPRAAQLDQAQVPVAGHHVGVTLVRVTPRPGLAGAGLVALRQRVPERHVPGRPGADGGHWRRRDGYCLHRGAFRRANGRD